jgi:hypothetical protein
MVSNFAFKSNLYPLHTGEGIHLAAWDGFTLERRKQYWSFMPDEALIDC